MAEPRRRVLDGPWVCPHCGSTEAQEHWRVASTAPVDIEIRDGEPYITHIDYDASKVIWDAVTYPEFPFECASCCESLKNPAIDEGVWRQ